jgi:asparagine synthase (glutamine-hydrolysing)
MCGLAGRFHPVALPPDPAWAGRADELLRHRGPDGAGRYADAYCQLVHRRLALIDLSPRGAQPMTNEDGSIQVVYNGEIYNHGDLRAALVRRGHVFKSSSDTEILVHLYEEEGANLVRALRGIFAFAIYDRPRRRLLLARDRYGVKPLFYAELDGEWVFASEIKAITARRGFVPRLDRQACYDFLGLGYVPEPATGFANVRALPPASVLTITPEGTRLAEYDGVVASPEPTRRLEDTVEALADRLLTAVRRQSVADVPVAALLSGGIDSSLVVATHERAGLGPSPRRPIAAPGTIRSISPTRRSLPRRCSACCGTSISRSPTRACSRCTGSRAPSGNGASSAPCQGTGATKYSEVTPASGGPTSSCGRRRCPPGCDTPPDAPPAS